MMQKRLKKKIYTFWKEKINKILKINKKNKILMILSKNSNNILNQKKKLKILKIFQILKIIKLSIGKSFSTFVGILISDLKELFNNMNNYLKFQTKINKMKFWRKISLIWLSREKNQKLFQRGWTYQTMKISKIFQNILPIKQKRKKHLLKYF